MRVLIYGGCHAGIIGRYLEQSPIIDVKVATNFLLIKEGTPLEPEIFLENVDLYIYSPVNNKPGFNTNILKNYADNAGIPSISFPWIQWNGYHPNLTRKVVTGKNQSVIYDWYVYQELEELAQSCLSLGDCDALIKSYQPSFDSSLLLAGSTARTAESEKGLDIKIVDFIEDNFRTQMLFHWPAHPTNILWEHILYQFRAKIESKLEIQSELPLPNHYIKIFGKELQCDSSIPILRPVSSELGLAFKNSIWRNVSFFGLKDFSIPEMVRFFSSPTAYLSKNV